MSVIGLVPVFEEADSIGYCVESMLAAGCSEVIVLDGAYQASDGSTFMGGGVASEDGTIEVAQQAGATVVIPDRQPRFGEKRQMLLELSGAVDGDYLLMMDADERAHGMVDREQLDGHQMLLLHNRKPNDLGDFRGEWPRGDAGGRPVPLLRLLRWSPTLEYRVDRRWYEDGERIEPYTVNALRAVLDSARLSPAVLEQLEEYYRQLRDSEEALTPEQACVFPIHFGLGILHVDEHSPERVAEKRRFYEGA